MIDFYWIVAQDDYEVHEQKTAELTYQRLFDPSAKGTGIKFHFLDIKNIEISFEGQVRVLYNQKNLLNDKTCLLLSNFSMHPSTERMFTTLYHIIQGSPACLLNQTYDGPAEWMSNKMVMASALSKLNVPVIPSIYLTSSTSVSAALNAFCNANMQFMAILKPNRLNRGIGITKIVSETDFRCIWPILKTTGLDYLMQPFIKHKTDIRVYLINRKVVTSQWRYPKSNDFRANISLGGHGITQDLPHKIKEISQYIAESWNADYLCVDWLYDPCKPIISEVCTTLGGFTGLSDSLKQLMANRLLEHIRQRITL